MVEKIINLLEEKDLNVRELEKILELEKDYLEVIMDGMIQKGIVIVTSKNKYRLVSKTNLKKAIVLEKKNGDTIVKFENNEYFVPTYYVNNAKSKDIVLVEINDNRAKIIRIIEKYNPNIACEVVMKNNKHYVLCEKQLIELCGKNLEDITSGYMVLVNRNEDFTKANLLEVIGHKDEIDMSVIPYAYEFGSHCSLRSGASLPCEFRVPLWG